MLKNKVLETIKKYNLINAGEHVVLGLSGGPDSMCLFYVLIDLQRALEFTLHAVHINHMMRDESADRDQEFVESICRDNGVACHSFKIDCNQMASDLKLTSEEAGRKARYESFTKVADEIIGEVRLSDKREGSNLSGSARSIVKIAVAHNADDQAETMLYRILRGTGTDGLAGIEHIRPEGKYLIIRPLLDINRSEIETFCTDNKVPFVIDETNEQPLYDRNKIRLELLPLIKDNYNSNIVSGLGRLAQIAGEDKDYLWEQTQKAWDRVVICDNSSAPSGGVQMRIVAKQDEVARLHSSIRHRLVLMALRKLNMWEDVTYERLQAFDQMVIGDSSTKILQLPHGYEVTFAFGKIYFSEPKVRLAENNIQIQYIEDVQRIEKIKERIANTGYEANWIYLDADKVLEAKELQDTTLADADNLDAYFKKCIVLRSRIEGDYIYLNSGKKKIKKLLGEMKVPANQRDEVHLIAIGKCVLSIRTPDGKSRFAEIMRVTSQTNKVLMIEI